MKKRPTTFLTKSLARWPRRPRGFLFVLLMVACAVEPTSTTKALAPSTSAPETTLATAPTTTEDAIFDPGDLAFFEPFEIDLGGTRHQVALADSEAERGEGMMGIGDVGDFTGMLFAWEEEVSTGFWMKDTLMPLDLYFYSATGELVDQVSMVPCFEADCQMYVSDVLFRWVLETPAGNLAPPLGPLTLITSY